jgi:hypothetical protein
MRVTPAFLGLLLVLVPPSAALAGDDMAARTAASREAIKSLAGTLTGQLSLAMADGGPVAAIEVCNLVAPEIAHTESVTRGWRVGRTSLKLRNPANAPDAWELAVLQDFAARKAAGEDPKALDHAEIVTADGRRSFRYMKAIVTMEVCTTCHGASVAPEIDDQLRTLYPEDRARGYGVGDIRGAFTVVQPLE